MKLTNDLILQFSNSLDLKKGVEFHFFERVSISFFVVNLSRGINNRLLFSSLLSGKIIHMRYYLHVIVWQSRLKVNSFSLTKRKSKKELIDFLHLQTYSKKSFLRNLHFLNKFPRKFESKNTCQLTKFSAVLVNVLNTILSVVFHLF